MRLTGFAECSPVATDVVFTGSDTSARGAALLLPWDAGRSPDTSCPITAVMRFSMPCKAAAVATHHSVVSKIAV